MDKFAESVTDLLLEEKPLSSLQIRYLLFLKQIEFKPAVFYDIGASHCAWSKAIKHLYPETVVVLFDASHKLGSLYEDDLHFFDCLSDEDGKTVNYYELPLDDRMQSYYKQKYFDNKYMNLRTTK